MPPMNNVTVPSAHSTTVTLAYDSSANAMLASYVANAIQTGIGTTAITAVDAATSGSPPPLFGGIGEWVQDVTQNTTIPKGYDYVVATVSATLIDQNSDTVQSVLAGSTNLSFNASGAGSVIAGGGNDLVIVPVSDSGAWMINLGGGNDTVKALGSGSDSISLGAGSDTIALGSGNYAVTTAGSATITGGSGTLVFLGQSAATVFGGAGSDTLTGVTGSDYFQAGTGGNSSLTAGFGSATLIGAASGDQLVARGSGAQILYAGAGNETLTGSTVSGAPDTFVGGSGSVTVNATAGASNVFQFVYHAGSTATEVVSGLTAIGQVDLHLVGYGSNSTASVTSQNNTGGNLNFTLSDGTQVTFKNVTSALTNSNFS